MKNHLLLSTAVVAIAMSCTSNANAFFGMFGGCGSEPSCGYADACGGCEASCGFADACAAASPNDVAYWPRCVLVALRRSAVKRPADVQMLAVADASLLVVALTPVAVDVPTLVALADVSRAVVAPTPVVAVVSQAAVVPLFAATLAASHVVVCLLS